MERSIYWKIFVCLILVLFFTYFTITNQYEYIARTLSRRIYSSNTPKNLENIDVFANSTHKTLLKALDDYYPKLPIHIYTQTIPSTVNTSKLILLGNGFFGDRSWGIPGVNKNSSDTSKNLRFFFVFFSIRSS